MVVCGHCRIAIMDANPDGSRINNPWMQCSWCKKMVCGEACKELHTQCWGAKAVVIEHPIVEGLGQPTAPSCERQSGAGAKPPPRRS